LSVLVCYTERVYKVSIFFYSSVVFGQTNYLRRIQRIWPLRILDRKRKRPCTEVTWLFLSIFPRTFFSSIFFPYFLPVLFSRTFSKVATFEIQRFKISVSCFSSTCCYSTVHVPCRICIQTSPVRLPLERWGARMRDLKGPKMNLFNPKKDWNVL
jgi:hypothetical protein